MLVFLSGPYSSTPDKNHLYESIMRASSLYMIRNQGARVVSPLFYHPALALVPEMGSDYNFWGDYSRELLQKCEKVIVLKYPGWDESTGVKDELATASAANIPVEYLEYADYQ
jgi:hypothetical protein